MLWLIPIGVLLLFGLRSLVRGFVGLSRIAARRRERRQTIAELQRWMNHPVGSVPQQRQS